MPAPSSESAPKKLRSKPTPRDRGVAQVRTIARRAGMDVNHLLVKLRAAGVNAVDNGPLYATSAVDLESAMKALSIQAENREAEKPLIKKLAEDAKATAATLPREPVKPYTGDETQPRPQYIVEGAFSEAYLDFPPIPNPDGDKVYYPVHVNPDRQHQKISQGFRFVVDPDHIKRIGLGTLERYINSRGRIQYKDRELAFLSLEEAERKRQMRRNAMMRDRQAIAESFEANVDSLRRSLGRGSDAKLTPFEMSEGEAVERAEHAEARRRGVTRVVLDMGSTPKTETR